VKVGLVVLGGVARVSQQGWVPCLHWLIERLARRHEVHVFSLLGAPRPDRYTLLGATVHHAGARPRRLRTLAAIVAEHRRAPFDLLHAFWVVPAGLVAACGGRLLGRPVLMHAAGGELVRLADIGYGGRLHWRGRVAVRLALSRAARITAASDAMIEALRRLGYRAERLPLGVDTTRWPVAPPRPRAPGEAARLVHVASLNRVKDQLTLLRAARRLADLGVAFRLDVAGPDTLGNEIQELAANLDLRDQVRFHGHLPHEQLHALVSAAHLLWLSSRHEAGPLVVLEAAIVGVPTVGTAVGHVREWAPEAAVAVPVQDAEALARAAVKVLADDERRMALAREAQRRALACDADWTARRFDALYAEVLEPRGSDRRAQSHAQ
jgi:glycosyltransferase involved in cell wall biosynthesis